MTKKRWYGIILVAVIVLVLAVVWPKPGQAPSPPPPGISADNQTPPTNMFITSPAFNNQETIPRKFTCSGGDINPELQIQNVPTGAKSLVLIVDDPDAPGGIFTHWTIWNIGSKTTVVKEESKPPSAVEGTTDFGRIGWGGPCPPPGTPHRYFFRLYAVDTLLDLPAGASRKQLEHAMEGHVLQAAELMGIFSR